MEFAIQSVVPSFQSIDGSTIAVDYRLIINGAVAAIPPVVNTAINLATR